MDFHCHPPRRPSSTNSRYPLTNNIRPRQIQVDRAGIPPRGQLASHSQVVVVVFSEVKLLKLIEYWFGSRALRLVQLICAEKPCCVTV
jgi:hypothetical protein